MHGRADLSEDFDGQTLKALRLERAWSQEQLAEISGLSARTVQRLEQGGKASLDTQKALAAALDVPVTAFRSPAPTPPGQEPQAMCATTDVVQPHHPKGLRHHLITYVAVIGSLAAWNLTRNPDHLWFVYPMIGWGLFVALHALRSREGTFFAERVKRADREAFRRLLTRQGGEPPRPGDERD